MKYYITFEKTGTLRFISHLDSVRLFQRVFKRAGFKMKYSEGFNPHPRMSLAQPLSLGYIGLSEILEFEVLTPLVSYDVPELLNGLLPPGMRVSSCHELPEDRKDSLSGLTYAARYDLYAEGDGSLASCMNGLVRDFLSRESVLAEKRIKKTKQIGEVEIRPMIREFAYLDVLEKDEVRYGMPVPCGSYHFTALLSAGSAENLNPEVLFRAFAKTEGIPYDKTGFHVIRTEILWKRDIDTNEQPGV